MKAEGECVGKGKEDGIGDLSQKMFKLGKEE